MTTTEPPDAPTAVEAESVDAATAVEAESVDAATDVLDLTAVELLPLRSVDGRRIRLLGYPAGGVAASWRSDLPAECTTYQDVIALPITAGGAGATRQRQLLGALYTADGVLIDHSERAKTNAAWGGNPRELAELPGPRMERLDGHTFFAGHHRSSFGHVLLEVLPRFWPDLDYASYDTLLFHPQRAGRRASGLALKPYARQLVDAATGGSPAALRIVAGRPLRLAEVTVASPGFWLKRGFSPAVRQVFERVADRLVGGSSGAAGDRPRKVYLSRSRLDAPDRPAENEHEIEDLVGAAGFTVVHPQLLAVAEQVALMRSAEVVAGCDGSALHLAVFARPGTRLLAFDSRPVPNQFVVDDLAGLDAIHVMAAAEEPVHGRSDAWRADLSRVRAALAVALVD